MNGSSPTTVDQQTLAPAERETLAVARSLIGNRTALVVLVACLVISCVLHFGFIRANSPTVDEFTHLQAGYRYWQCGEFANNPEHPPLIKLVAAWPIRNWQLSGFNSSCGEKVIGKSDAADVKIAYALATSPNATSLIRKARSAMLIFPLLLIAAVFFAARSWFGNTAACIAALLVTFEPTLVAHTSLITSDGALATFAFSTVFFGVEFVRRGRMWQFAGASLSLGLALSSKHSAAVLPLLLLLAMLLTRRLEPKPPKFSLPRLLGYWMAMSAISTVVLWATYGFRYASLPGAVEPLYPLARSFHLAGLDGSLIASVVAFIAKYHLLPEAYLGGLADVVFLRSRQAYFFGQIYPAGIWYYFPVALVIKTTAGLIVLSIAAIATPDLWRRHRTNISVLVLSAFFFLASGMASRMNIGIRHILPIYPFLVVMAAAAAAAWMQRGRRFAIAATVLLIVSLSSALYVVPNQLSYASELFGGSKHLHRLLADSNLDWGQSADKLEAYLSANFSGRTDCAVAPSFLPVRQTSCTVLPTLFDWAAGPQSQTLVPEWFEGTLIFQPLAGAATSAYLPFLNGTPDEVDANGTILVYRGKFDLREVAALRRLERGSYFLIQERDAVSAEREFAAASQHCPETSRVELELAYTMALAAQERWDEARTHAYQVLRLTENNPSRRVERQVILDALAPRN